MLLAGLEAEVKNPCWDFRLDVEGRSCGDRGDADVVAERIRQNEQSEDDQKGEEKPEEKKESGDSPVKTVQKLRQRTQSDLSNPSYSSKASLDDPRRHLRVLTALNDMQTMSAQGVGASTVDPNVISDMNEINDLENTLEKGGRSKRDLRLPHLE